ncbi:30S ribosomal protein S19e [Sulfurisphaera tokodaii]|uniref:Small ribosomal subunit protein eS19 n=2 Tax=Sulfurisphaera tokodaii TaxID=111955 RepID=Q971H9_SULTO|nr:30S ribosomal protein S19e [Sulfurisphaera tokodaii]BAB66441.1 30S ribosomal protein S19e [Sulfurisphaera tokodaii str. 7]HII73745.1 30S ribosomal protein S19e [Sulfurisphaera tokodaii]
MITPKMVPADVFIPRLAQYLRENVKELQPAEWSYFAKTSSFNERVPDNPEIWWYVRAASLLRKLYFISPLGVGTTRRLYSGLKRRGAKPPRTVKAPGHANRLILRQLEKAGLVIRTKKGRVLSPKGRSLLDKLSYEMFKELAEKKPELKKYLE